MLVFFKLNQIPYLIEGFSYGFLHAFQVALVSLDLFDGSTQGLFTAPT
jgi:hypothetical protein